MRSETELIEVNDWIVRMRRPEGAGIVPIFLLLHGLTGDEDAMWVFANRLPANYLMVAPRGLYASPLGGYSWQDGLRRGWPHVEDLTPAAEALLQLMEDIQDKIDGVRADYSIYHLMGFSQGAALAYTLGLIAPSRVGSIVGLSGFLPNGSTNYVNSKPLQGKQVFMAHGTQDELVPVARARQALELLELAGALVTYCEDDVGHKLSADCFRGFQSFILRIKGSGSPPGEE